MYPSKNLPSIGQMNRKLVLKRPTFVASATGSKTVFYSTIRTFWVFAQQINSNEDIIADSAEKKQNWLFVGKYSTAEILKGDILEFEGKELRNYSFNIIDGRNKFIEIKGTTIGNTYGNGGESGGSNGSGSGGGAAYLDADTSGTTSVALGKFMTYTLNNVTEGTKIEIINKGSSNVIDFGDGNGIKSYTANTSVIKTYKADETGTITIKIYHNDDLTVHFIRQIERASAALDGGVNGDIPTSLITYGCTTLRMTVPPTLPTTCKRLFLTGNSFTAVSLAPFIQSLIDNNQSGGVLYIVWQNPSIDYSSLAINLGILVARSWEVLPSPTGVGGVDANEYANLDYIDFAINNASGVPTKITLAKTFYVNWGNAVIKYNGNTEASYSLVDQNYAVVRIYYQPDETYIKFKCTTQTLVDISGTFPESLQTLDLSRDYGFTRSFIPDGLLSSVAAPGGSEAISITKATTSGITSLPLDILPSSLLSLDVSNNSLDTSSLDDLLNWCNNLSGTISLTIGLQKPNAKPSDLVALQELVNNGSSVIISQGSGSGFGLFRCESFEASSVGSISGAYSKTLEINLTSVGNSVVSIGTINPCIIDWGNGKIYEYPDATLARCQYLNETDIQIKVYHTQLFTPLLGRIYIEGVAGQTAVIDSINELSSADYINISNINVNLAGIAPNLNKNWMRVESNLSVSEVNDIIDLADSVSGNVQLMIRQTPPAPPTNPALSNIFETMHD